MLCRVSCKISAVYGRSALTLQAEGRRLESVNSHNNKRSKKMSEDIFFLFLVLQQTNLFVGWSSKNKKVDLSTSCVVQFLQGPPRRAERKGVKRSEHQ